MGEFQAVRSDGMLPGYSRHYTSNYIPGKIMLLYLSRSLGERTKAVIWISCESHSHNAQYWRSLPGRYSRDRWIFPELCWTTFRGNTWFGICLQTTILTQIHRQSSIIGSITRNTANDSYYRSLHTSSNQNMKSRKGVCSSSQAKVESSTAFRIYGCYHRDRAPCRLWYDSCFQWWAVG